MQKRFFHYRSTTLLHLQNDCVAVKVAANDNEAFIAVAIVVAVKAVGIVSTLTATGLLLLPAGGYEVEVLIGQLDGVSEIGHLLHVGLLSLFCQWRNPCCNCCHVITSCKTPIWMHGRANFVSGTCLTLVIS